MKISLIIATYNNPIFLEMVFLSLQKQVIDYDHKVEIIVADDGSTMETKNLIEVYQEKMPFPLKHVWHEDQGFRLARIRNLAVSHSLGEYLIFLDGDCLVPKDFISYHIKLMEKYFLVAGNRILISKNQTEEMLSNKDITVLDSGFLKGLINRCLGKTNKYFPSLRLNPHSFFRKKHLHKWRIVKGCHMAIWRDDYMRVNGFDESFVGWGYEDSDMVVRLSHLGVLIKNGRFAVSVFHLWHKENSRDKKNVNYDRLMERIEDPFFIEASIGMKQVVSD